MKQYPEATGTEKGDAIADLWILTAADQAHWTEHDPAWLETGEKHTVPDPSAFAWREYRDSTGSYGRNGFK